MAQSSGSARSALSLMSVWLGRLPQPAYGQFCTHHTRWGTEHETGSPLLVSSARHQGANLTAIVGIPDTQPGFRPMTLPSSLSAPEVQAEQLDMPMLYPFATDTPPVLIQPSELPVVSPIGGPEPESGPLAPREGSY